MNLKLSISLLITSLTAFAGNITIQPGESIDIYSNRDSRVTCEGSTNQLRCSIDAAWPQACWNRNVGFQCAIVEGNTSRSGTCMAAGSSGISDSVPCACVPAGR